MMIFNIQSQRLTIIRYMFNIDPPLNDPLLKDETHAINEGDIKTFSCSTSHCLPACRIYFEFISVRYENNWNEISGRFPFMGGRSTVSVKEVWILHISKMRGLCTSKINFG